MAETTALSAELREGIRRVGEADIVVGIPSFRNAGTIGHVATVAAEGLRRHFGDARVAIVNADGGSEDGTTDRVRASADGVPAVAGRYQGRSGKGSAFRAIFEAVGLLGARACAVVDSDLRSITPEWIERLVGPIVRGEAEYVTPLYARHKYDGTITNTIAYPLTRALYGARIRQPIGGEFGFSSRLASTYVSEPVWDTDVARFGIDIFMTTTALVGGARIAQAFLGAKIHDPKDPGADLGPMFTQVVGTLLALARRPEAVAIWSGVSGSRDVPVIGEIRPVEPEAVNASMSILIDKFQAGAQTEGRVWDALLGADVRATIEEAVKAGHVGAIDDELWARTVYDIVAAARDRDDTEVLARALLPVYFARVAALIDEVKELDSAGAERHVEAQALAFERFKPSLVERWSASEPSRA
ncbi:MAG: hypothetical protein E6H84_06225 [Chloroflexi bacterium]|nr:MAG: hypothetical protein E6H84_06225 [Chloroflexota bacterium]TMG70952.1 MAG: hypothetical protein E6H81_05710 [Chloroflexota bacterium]